MAWSTSMKLSGTKPGLPAFMRWLRISFWVPTASSASRSLHGPPSSAGSRASRSAAGTAAKSASCSARATWRSWRHHGLPRAAVAPHQRVDDAVAGDVDADAALGQRGAAAPDHLGDAARVARAEVAQDGGRARAGRVEAGDPLAADVHLARVARVVDLHAGLGQSLVPAR